MAAAAELGPLDVQVSHPDKEEITISALDISDAIEFLSEKAFNLAISGGAAGLDYLSPTKPILRPIPYNNISKYELDRNEPPLAVLLAYSRASGIPLENLIDDELALK